MEKSLSLAAVCFRFCLLDAVSGFPIDFSTLGAGEPNGLWLTSYFLTGAGFFIAVIGVVFGCVCCRNSKGFKEFSNSSGSLAPSRSEGFVNPTSNSELTIFPPAGSSSSQIRRFEPLPDIKHQAPNLRPAAFSYSEREISSQDWFSEPYNNFPRNQLKYLQEYGRGWFGRVVEGEAQNITPKEKLTKVMVKILHEDATPTDQMYFLHEVKFYRDLKHPNILRLLGRCLETEPFLIILECYPNGDLKTFLSQNLASARALAEQGVTLQMCSNITSGLQFMHEYKFIHTDLAARNCLVGPDLSVKIGDYGNSIEIFKSDYYCAGSVALPVRWCAPETLKCTDVTIETREVTQPANIWSLAVVFWEICEFCKLPYAELNDDQVIVRVLGEKNYFLEKPNMFCLHKEELYHLMKLCWNPPLQRPTASQILVILDNLILSGKASQKDIHLDSKRTSLDFEQRWQNLRPNYIPKRDNAVEVEHNSNCNIISSKLKNAKVVDSSLVDSPLGIFMSNESSGQESPRFCLKPEKSKHSKLEENSKEMTAKENICADKNFNLENKGLTAAERECLNDMKNPEAKIDFEYTAEVKQSEIFKPERKFKVSAPDVDSWLKGVEINNEEDESFVRKISEAIRDLDATLAMEKTSSSEENSGKSSHQNSPGKDLKEGETVVDFKLGSDTSSFMNFTQKSFELSSLQNTEQPQSLDFTDPFLGGKKGEFEDTFGPSSLIMPLIEESKRNFNIKSDIFDESLKEQDSLVYSQSRNSSDTDDEIWRKRIEKGEISEKVKEKSKSIANLMILTHIDASDDSDIDLDKPFEKGLNRNSFLRRSGSFAKSSLTSNNFGSENDLTHAVLEDEFKESLKKLSNDHKEYGHFDSLGMILPSTARRENVWENLFKSEPIEKNSKDSQPSLTQTNINKKKEESEQEGSIRKNLPPEGEQGQHTENSNNFLGDVASEKFNDATNYEFNEDGVKNTEVSDFNKLEKKETENSTKCANSTCKTDDGGSSEQNSSHLSAEESVNLMVFNENENLPLNEYEETKSGRPLEKELEQSCENILSVSNDEMSLQREILSNKFSEQNNKAKKPDCVKGEPSKVGIIDDSKGNLKENSENSYKKLSNILPVIPEIIMTEAENDDDDDDDAVFEEVYEPIKPQFKPIKFILKDRDFIPQITITEDTEAEEQEEQEEEFELSQQPHKPFKFVLKEEKTLLEKEVDEKAIGFNQKNSLPSSALYKPIYKDTTDEVVSNDCSSVIIGACEDYTLDYFKGLKTTSDDISVDCCTEKLNEKDFKKIIEDLRDKEANLDIWDKHLEKAFTQQLNNTDFNDISFKSYSLDFAETDNLSDNQGLIDSKNFSVKTIADFIESEKIHTDKLEEQIPLNSMTNVTEVGSEEDYDNFKLRTPDDERSSDSGFRDKGSLSESVEDACEGKYNLEDIEAELEEAFGNSETEKERNKNKDSLKNCNFEYEESQFYEDENKNEEDFSDIDGEIEFWQSKDNSDYYPEISEFNPTCSQGWYLHPPDESPLGFNRNVNEDLVNALRNELQETLPIQCRSFEEFSDFYESGICDPKRELNIHYLSDFGIPLSPILEEQDFLLGEITKRNIKNSFLIGTKNNKARDNVINIMESVKSIDTNTFRQYLDYMIENEGKGLDDIEEIDEKTDGSKEESETVSPILILEKDSTDPENKNFEEEIKNALGVDSIGRSESVTSDLEQNSSALLVEDLESGCTSKVAQEAKIEDDILFVNIDTNEVTMMETPKPKAYMAFLESSERKEDLEVAVDNLENEGLIFTPELLSPDKEGSLSEISRSSNGTRTGDALSDITLSSPDLVPDCFSTSIHEIIQNNEAGEIMKELEDSGVTNGATSPVEDNGCSPINISKNRKVQNEFFLLRHVSDTSEDSSELQKNSECDDSFESHRKTLKLDDRRNANDQYEMTTSFMGDDDEDESSQGLVEDGNETEERKKDREVAFEDSYTADWESESSEGEEMSSSSGEFIWKDGDKESKVKAIQATDCDVEYSLREKLQKKEDKTELPAIISSPIKEIDSKEKSESEAEEDDDNDSSTGSSASITDFVPSAWNSQATPSRPALKSPDKKVDQQQKKNVWFKKQKYHCVYEYPREPSDNEDGETSFSHFNYEKSTSDSPSKHFTFSVNTVEPPNKHFPYGISNVIDYSSYTDWDVVDGEDGDLSLTDTESENGLGKTDVKKESDFNFYNLNPFDYDFTNTGTLNEESEFFVSSSSRPFQVSSSSQFFPGRDQIFNNTSNSEKTKNSGSIELYTKDFVTPDSGLDSTSDTPLDKSLDLNKHNIFLQMENLSDPKPGILNLLDNMKFNFTPEIVEPNIKKLDLKSFGDNTNLTPSAVFTGNSNGPASPLSSTGLGELRHTRDKLKLDLPHNHNAELGTVVNKKNHQNSLKS